MQELNARNINPEEIKKALKGVTIPPRPTVSLEIKEVYPDVSKIADIVSRDPGIASALLRTINSPFYGLKYEIKSIRQAAVYVGLDSVINIVNAVLLRATMGSAHLDQAFMNSFWDSANDTAVAMTALCQFLGLPAMADEAYTTGLFHNCGMPLLMHKYANYVGVITTAYQQPDKDIMQVEMDNFNSSHAAVGFYVCKTWGLQESICNAILDHHDRKAIPELMQEMCDAHTLLGLLKMAEKITMEHEILGRTKDDYEWGSIKSPVLDYFELTEMDYTDLQEQIVEQIDADQAQRLKV